MNMNGKPNNPKMLSSNGKNKYIYESGKTVNKTELVSNKVSNINARQGPVTNSPIINIKVLNIDGINYTKLQDPANHLNGFFVNKIERIKQNLGQRKQDPLLTLKAAIGKWEKCGQIRSFIF